MSIDFNAAMTQLEAAGDLWFLALVGSFFVMICEAAKPKPADGESRAGPEGFGLLVMILSLLTPLMLFVHAFLVSGRAPNVLFAVIVVIGAAIIGAALIGWMISAFMPAIGRTLNRAAPVLAVTVFALAAYVTWPSVFGLANMLIAGQPL